MYIGLLIGGLIIILSGLNAYLSIISPSYATYSGPIFLIVLGIIIIVIAIFAAMAATKRSPRPP